MIRNAKLISALLLTIGLNVACGNGSGEQSLSSAESGSLPACQITAACNQTLPTLAKAKGFNGFYNKILTKLGKPLHRGRDIIVTPGAPVWIQAKFTYGLLDSDLHHENIDIYLSQGCDSPMKKIGYGFTSNDGENNPVDGVEDSGGRIYVNLATLGIKDLPIGRHRVVLVVQGDNSMTELYITVVDPRQKIAVADIDGTLTESELAAAVDVLGGQAPARANSVAAIRALVAKGYHILYLTARPEWLEAETRKWLTAQGFPIGTIRTTDSKVGA
ncbi:MAG: phosphatidylinositol transfer protein, partial [Proteobacteria bacterium]